VLSVGVLDAANIIREKLNIPVLVLDGDHADERVYSEAETMMRIDTFLEMLGSIRLSTSAIAETDNQLIKERRGAHASKLAP
jgi:hypothetical protein